MEVVWEYQQTAKKWVRYESIVSDKLTEEIAKGTSTFEMKVDNSDVNFDFEALKQNTSGTKTSKYIRCAVYNSAQDYIIWEYLNTRRRWISFTPDLATKLETYYVYSADIDITFKGKKATVSFRDNLLYNEDTEEETIIRRVVSDARLLSDPQPAGYTTSTRSKKRKDDNENVKPRDEEVVSKKTKLEEAFKGLKKSKTLFAEVDEYCPNKEKVRVYVEKNDVYNVMLNQTNISQNNNKYFLIQLLKATTDTHYWVFFRWGRVGFKGQNKLVDCEDDLDMAKKTFCDKFFDKTDNEFLSRKKFVKTKGKYDLIEMDYSKAEEPSEPDAPDVPLESKLHEKIQEFLKLICDMKKMEEAAKGLSYDINRAPLGKLTKSQIKAGYEALKKIEDCILSNKFNKDFKDAIDEYYTRIPHYFGMRPPSTITTLDELKQELELLEVLSEIEAAVSSINQQLESADHLHPIDKTYLKLKCDIQLMNKDSSRYKLIETYLQNTHATRHGSYSMTLKNVYEINKHGEASKFKADLGNKMLLWHGSRLTNWHGILSRGLKIAPKEAPVTGYMFGKGVYFADASSKSANYCCAYIGGTGVLVLAEVALGYMNPKFQADGNSNQLPEGMSSVKGVGKFAPNSQQYVTIDDDVIVPSGELIEQAGIQHMTSLYFNEYIVYNTDQIKLRYLVEVEFHNPQ